MSKLIEATDKKRKLAQLDDTDSDEECDATDHDLEFSGCLPCCSKAYATFEESEESVDERELDRQWHEQHRERLIQEQREYEARAALTATAHTRTPAVPAPALVAAAAGKE